jgi:hypothetical protein
MVNGSLNGCQTPHKRVRRGASRIRPCIVRFPVPSRLTSTAPSSAASVANCIAICAGRTRIGAPRRALVIRAAREEHGTSAAHGRAAVGLDTSVTVEGTVAAGEWCSGASASGSGVGVGVAGVVERGLHEACKLVRELKSRQ